MLGKFGDRTDMFKCGSAAAVNLLGSVAVGDITGAALYRVERKV
jgi:hypothetical protein